MEYTLIPDVLPFHSGASRKIYSQPELGARLITSPVHGMRGNTNLSERIMLDSNQPRHEALGLPVIREASAVVNSHAEEPFSRAQALTTVLAPLLSETCAQQRVVAVLAKGVIEPLVVRDLLPLFSILSVGSGYDVLGRGLVPKDDAYSVASQYRLTKWAISEQVLKKLDPQQLADVMGGFCTHITQVFVLLIGNMLAVRNPGYILRPGTKDGYETIKSLTTGYNNELLTYLTSQHGQSAYQELLME